MTSKLELLAWFNRGVVKEATHMIVVCDTYDWEDFPVYVTPDQDVHEEVAKHSSASMEKVMEVYNLRLDPDPQLAEHRAFNY